MNSVGGGWSLKSGQHKKIAFELCKKEVNLCPVILNLAALVLCWLFTVGGSNDSVILSALIQNINIKTSAFQYLQVLYI